MCFAPGGDRVGVALDGGRGSLPGARQVVLGPVELLFGDVDVASESVTVPPWAGGELVQRGGVAPVCFDRSHLGVVQRVAIGDGRSVDLRVGSVGAGDRRGDVGTLC